MLVRVDTHANVPEWFTPLFSSGGPLWDSVVSKVSTAAEKFVFWTHLEGFSRPCCSKTLQFLPGCLSTTRERITRRLWLVQTKYPKTQVYFGAVTTLRFVDKLVEAGDLRYVLWASLPASHHSGARSHRLQDPLSPYLT